MEFSGADPGAGRPRNSARAGCLLRGQNLFEEKDFAGVGMILSNVVDGGSVAKN